MRIVSGCAGQTMQSMGWVLSRWNAGDQGRGEGGTCWGQVGATTTMHLEDLNHFHGPCRHQVSNVPLPTRCMPGSNATLHPEALQCPIQENLLRRLPAHLPTLDFKLVAPLQPLK